MRDGGCPGCWPARARRHPGPRGVELHQLEPTVAVRGLHHRVLHPDALEPDHAVHPTALDLPLSLQLESEFDEERRRGLEVVDHDAHVLRGSGELKARRRRAARAPAASSARPPGSPGAPSRRPRVRHRQALLGAGGLEPRWRRSGGASASPAANGYSSRLGRSPADRRGARGTVYARRTRAASGASRPFGERCAGRGRRGRSPKRCGPPR